MAIHTKSAIMCINSSASNFDMRTNIVLDEKLVKAGLAATGIKTRKALIDYALRELLRHQQQLKLLQLQGKIHWEGNLESSREGREK